MPERAQQKLWTQDELDALVAEEFADGPAILPFDRLKRRIEIGTRLGPSVAIDNAISSVCEPAGYGMVKLKPPQSKENKTGE